MKIQFPFVDVNFLPSTSDRTGILARQESRELLVEMMGFHARRHHLIPVEIPHPACLFPSAIHQECTEEVYQFCVARNLPDAWAYLACEWYCVERWTLWARSAISGVIPCADTTMMVESHWSLLKRHHLINSPRARFCEKPSPIYFINGAKLWFSADTFSLWNKISLKIGIPLQI